MTTEELKRIIIADCDIECAKGLLDDIPLCTLVAVVKNNIGVLPYFRWVENSSWKTIADKHFEGDNAGYSKVAAIAWDAFQAQCLKRYIQLKGKS